MHREDVPLSFDCHEDWNQMEGGQQQRHCHQCHRDVYDLSAMTRREAHEVLQHGKPCVRYAMDPQTGAIRHRPERAPRTRVKLVTALVLATMTFEVGTVVAAPEYSPLRLLGKAVSIALSDSIDQRFPAQDEVVQGVTF